MVRYEQDRERSFLVSMMNFDLVRGVITAPKTSCSTPTLHTDIVFLYASSVVVSKFGSNAPGTSTITRCASFRDFEIHCAAHA